MDKQVCEVADCPNQVRARGYCVQHYAQMRRSGALRTLSELNSGPCTIAGCSKPAARKQLCNAHYTRILRHGDPEVLKISRRPPDGMCTIPDCDRDWLSRGYCKSHYERFMKYGDPLGSAPKPQGCSVPGCDRPHKGRGYCSSHLRRLKIYGDPEGTPPAWEPYACKVEGCTDERYALDLCSSHYVIFKKYGDPTAVPQRGKKTLLTRPNINCETCGQSFSPGTSPHRRFCSRGCRPGKRSSTYRGRLVVLRLAERDGWHCKLCDEEVDKSLHFPHPLSGSIDHVVPVSLGGSDEFANLQLSHRRCNIMKGNRIT